MLKRLVSVILLEGCRLPENFYREERETGTSDPWYKKVQAGPVTVSIQYSKDAGPSHSMLTKGLRPE